MTSNRVFLLSLPFVLSLGGACAPADSPPINRPDGGAGTAGGGSGGGAGGAGGSGTGGNIGSGGSIGSGGAGGSGGTTGTGGSGGGTGGSAMDASAGGTGGGAADAATETPTMNAQLCVAGDCTNVVGMLDNYFIDGKCTGPKVGPDCVPTWCSGVATREINKSFPLTGPAATAGGVYELTLQIRGVQECKRYNGGTRQAGAMGLPIAQEQKQWHIGGTVPASPYNSQELHVMPPVAAAAGFANDYYMNSCGTNQTEAHYTYLVNYEAKMRVNGGGTIAYKQLDSNCRQINNCGTAEATAACPTNQHVVNMATPNPPGPPVPAHTFTQPLVSVEGARGQFMHIDVTSVIKLP